MNKREKQLQSVTVIPIQKHQSTINLSDYQMQWKEDFQIEKHHLKETLKEKALMIEHVGSTSVEGLCAKPIIDILLIVEDSSKEEDYLSELEEAGYWLKIREPDWNQHRMFKGPRCDINLHVFSQGCKEAKRMLMFRDWLRQHPEDRDLYAHKKKELSLKVWEYIQDYADAKSEVVREIMERAEVFI
ncbi:MAG: GrpB family protein [Longibaculum sp.]